jgi:hypothetical protein
MLRVELLLNRSQEVVPFSFQTFRTTFHGRKRLLLLTRPVLLSAAVRRSGYHCILPETKDAKSGTVDRNKVRHALRAAVSELACSLLKSRLRKRGAYTS